MAIRREPFDQIHVDHVTDRWEILLKIGPVILRARRSTRSMTVYLPGPPRPIEHWGPTADQQLEGPELDARIACGLIAADDAQKEREKARQIHCLEPEWQNYGLIGGSAKVRAQNAKEVAEVAVERKQRADELWAARKKKRGGPAVGALLRDSNPIG